MNKEELSLKNKYREILENNEELKIWEMVDDDCYIGTMGYSEENVKILLILLKSFEEQYGEVIDLESAREELMLYQNYGKLFIYFDKNMRPVSMNGCIFNYENETVEFKGGTNSLYFYGLSTIPEYRHHGACKALINFAILFAKYNDFDFVYARTDLRNSNSEHLMRNAGLEICKYKNKIITEWVDVTEDKGDYRLHLWLPLKGRMEIIPKGNVCYASDDENREITELNPMSLKLNKPNY